MLAHYYRGCSSSGDEDSTFKEMLYPCSAPENCSRHDYYWVYINQFSTFVSPFIYFSTIMTVFSKNNSVDG